MGIRKALLTTACTSLALYYSAVAWAQNAPPQGRPLRSPGSYQQNAAQRPAPIRHLLYVATPGDNGADDQSGIVVLDADHDYRFVKRIPYGLSASEMPGEKVSGIAASVPENQLYVTFDGHMIALDLKTDKLAWTFNGEANVTRHYGGAAANGCCERPWTLPDGKTLLVASSYNDWVYYLDAHTGKVSGKVMSPDTPITHNLVVTPDGKTLLLGSISGPEQHFANVAVIDVPSHKVLRTLTFSDDVRPLTINHDGTLVYVNVNNLDGFEIGDARTGKVLKRVELPGDMWKAKWADPNNHYFGHGLPSHGLGLTPDESEIWVTDVINDAWQVWDNSPDGLNPVYNPSKTIHVTPGVGSSWISMTNDGKLAFVGDGSIIDVRAHKVIGTMKDEYGRPIHAAEKVLYMAFQEGKLIETNNQFAVGDPQAYHARVTAQASVKKEASN
jgi:outer membrane protein assembly factor BamB